MKKKNRSTRPLSERVFERSHSKENPKKARKASQSARRAEQEEAQAKPYCHIVIDRNTGAQTVHRFATPQEARASMERAVDEEEKRTGIRYPIIEPPKPN